MGLDIVELVMRTEEVFGITIPNEDAEKIITVGNLYEVVCVRLGLPPLPTRPIGSALPSSLNAWTSGTRRITPGFDPPGPPPWTHEELWATVAALVIDQLQVDESEVTYDAGFQNDLGAD